MWGSLIAAGVGYLGAKKAASATQSAAESQAAALQEAAKPRTVYDPLGGAYYNPETDQYELMSSPQMQALQQGLFYDAMQQRANVEPYMTRGGFESEVARRSREEENLIKQATAEALGDVQGKLLKRGTLGTTMGAGALAEVARKGAEAGIAARQAQRGLLSGEITDALNRAAAARQGMIGVGSYPSSLANIGQGMATSALGAAQSASPLLQSAANMNIQAGMQPYAQLSGMLGGLSRQNYQNQYGNTGVPSWASWL
jgi:hypothetical protein